MGVSTLSVMLGVRRKKSRGGYRGVGGFEKVPKNQKYIYIIQRGRGYLARRNISTYHVDPPTACPHRSCILPPEKVKTCRLFVNANFLPFPLSLPPPKTKASQFGHC